LIYLVAYQVVLRRTHWLATESSVLCA